MKVMIFHWLFQSGQFWGSGLEMRPETLWNELYRLADVLLCKSTNLLPVEILVKLLRINNHNAVPRKLFFHSGRSIIQYPLIRPTPASRRNKYKQIVLFYILEQSQKIVPVIKLLHRYGCRQF